MQTDTARLEIRLLTPEQLTLWLDDLPRLERRLECRYRAEPLAGDFRTIVEMQRTATLADAASPQWHSFWFLIRKTDRTVVGSAVFKERPDPEGCVEIGYGLGRAFERNGYMREAVEALCAWALRQEGVRHVTAETNTDGLASQRLLLKCGFRRTQPRGNLSVDSVNGFSAARRNLRSTPSTSTLSASSPHRPTSSVPVCSSPPPFHPLLFTAILASGFSAPPLL